MASIINSYSENKATLSVLVLLVIVLNDFNILNTKRVSASPASIVQNHDWNDLLMTITEKEKLDLFRERVINELPEDYMKTDFYLVRWLRARNFDINNAREMLLENLKWRKINKIDDILNEDFSDVSGDCSILVDTHDLKGRPVGVINFGLWDLRSAVYQGKVQRILRYLDRFFEQLVQQIFEAQSAGSEITRAIVLVDLEEFSLMQHMCSSCLSVYIRMLVSLESHYPGFVEEYIVVNTPSIFHAVLNTLQGVMSEQTRKVVKIFDTNKRHWMTYLDERIEPNERYINFGGTKKAHDC